MQICEKFRKLDELNELSLETYALIDVLERALKYDEFKDCQNASNAYLAEIIREKFDKISIIIENMQFDVCVKDSIS